MFNIGPPELIVLLLVALLVVGPKRLPEVGKTIGRSLREFRKAQDDLKSSFNFDIDEDTTGKKTTGPPKREAATPEPDDEPPGSEESTDPPGDSVDGD